jgi:hypothetical protein
MTRTYHIDGTLPENDEIFVFGSNDKGYHSLGAALIAAQKFGAIRYQAEGRQGNSYGIVTRWWHDGFKRMFTLPNEVIATCIEEFCEYTLDHPELRFFVTAVACGHAGYRAELIAPYFKDAINCSFPEDWENYLEE